jgi:hypothetical protein
MILTEKVLEKADSVEEVPLLTVVQSSLTQVHVPNNLSPDHTKIGMQI